MPNGGGKLRGISGGANKQRQVIQVRPRPSRKINHGLDILTQTELPGVFRDPNNVGRGAPAVERDRLVDRALPRPEPSRHRSVDDDHSGMAGSINIGFGKGTAFDDRNAGNFEIIGKHHPILDG